MYSPVLRNKLKDHAHVVYVSPEDHSNNGDDDDDPQQTIARQTDQQEEQTEVSTDVRIVSRPSVDTWALLPRPARVISNFISFIYSLFS